MTLTEQDIFVCDEPFDKERAIRFVADRLCLAGMTTADYYPGMLQREAQVSTYLGNSIAIPHGTTALRDAVLQTGVQVVAFRQGVDWGEGNTAYLVVGIAARSDEHLSVLRNLTRVLGDDSVPARIANIQTAADILAILTQAPAEDRASLSAAEHELSDTFILQNEHGLHARPAAFLVKEARKFGCDIEMYVSDAPDKRASAKSMMKVIGLGAKCGQRLTFSASGEEAKAALQHLGELIASGLGEPLPDIAQKRHWFTRWFA